MANPEHLQILEQGVEAWNQWRCHNPDIKPDLFRADLIVLMMMGDLKMVNFSGANLVGARCSPGSLALADFTDAHLSSADFAMTDLTLANFTRAYLWRTDFTQADLAMANLSEVHLLNTVFGETNLTDVQGLETCHHKGPSTLDHRTLAQLRAAPPGFSPWLWLERLGD